MRKSILIIFLTILFFFVSTAFAAGEMKSHDMQMQDSKSVGKLIRETNIDGYHLSYRLIDMQAQMKNENQGMNMQGMNGTHHLMLTIQDAQGKIVDSAQAGYLIIGPDGAEQKVMTMGMNGSYGADVRLSQPGENTIKCKVTLGEKKLLDEFTF
jgi:hypothetical protein